MFIGGSVIGVNRKKNGRLAGLSENLKKMADWLVCQRILKKWQIGWSVRELKDTAKIPIHQIH